MTLVVAAAIAGLDSVPAAGDDRRPERIRPGEPALASGTLREAVAELGRRQPAGPPRTPRRLLVDVRHHLESSVAKDLIEGLGGQIYAQLEGVLLEAFIPVDRAVELESHPGVRFLRPPLSSWPVSPPELPRADRVSAVPVLGEEVAKTRADLWHAAGVDGAGVKVGIIDIFDAASWDAARAAGEVPQPAGEFCRNNGAPCNIWGFPDADHGTAVAEIIHEMAPGAEIYLAFASTPGDYLQAIDYFAGQGVAVLNNSSTAEYDGPGDGTGQRAGIVDHAVSSGIAWFNSAGNEAGGGGHDGAYWRGGWTDADGDGWLEFAPGDEELNLFCDWSNGLRWNDWTDPSASDYDIFLFDDLADLAGLGDYPADALSAQSRAKAYSWDDQTAGADPVENYNAGLGACAGDGDVDYLRVGRWDPGGGSAGDILEFMLLQKVIEHWQNPYSASGPYSDTGSPGGLSVGAIDPPTGTEIGTYSSWGPTNDGRTKPDLSTAAGMANFTFGTFQGTSAASPTAAGAAALVIDAGLAATPSQVRSYLLDHATVDRGAAGEDNVYGRGELILPDPPTDTAGPLATGVVADPSPAFDNQPVTVTASIDDSPAGGTRVAAAAITVDGGSEDQMAPADGAFDEVTEVVVHTLAPLPAGNHQLCVRGIDALDNQGAPACVTLEVRPAPAVDDEPPSVSSVEPSPDPVMTGLAPTLTATVSDTGHGGSIVASASWRTDHASGSMAAADGAFDEASERVTATLPPFASPGLEEVCVTGTDVRGNSGSSCTQLEVNGAALGTVTRLAGADRYRTAVETSQASFAPGVPVAYIAVGDNFPDALAAGPAAAAKGGPILLTQTQALPAATAGELSRLDPRQIVVVGGSAVVSDAVLGQLRSYTTGSVSRLAGADRYRTAVETSQASFAPGVPVAYIAVGDNFPDALAAGPTAGRHQGPILLTQRDVLPSATRGELSRLRPRGIVVVGGTGVISAEVEAALSAYLP